MATTSTIEQRVVRPVTRSSATALSVIAFGVYALVLGAALAVVPGFVLDLMRLPAGPDHWARVAGLVVMGIGLYDLVGARYELTPFMRATVYGRYGFALAVTALVLTVQLPRPLLLFAAIDIATATWTLLALRHDARRAARR